MVLINQWCWSSFSEPTYTNVNVNNIRDVNTFPVQGLGVHLHCLVSTLSRLSYLWTMTTNRSMFQTPRAIPIKSNPSHANCIQVWVDVL
jgi:hypothetical protein